MALELNARETALVLIDLQNYIVSRGGAPHLSKGVVERCARLAEKVRSAGGTVAYVHVLLNETVHLPADRSWPQPSEPYPASASELVPEAGYRAGDLLIAKRQWGAFHATHLDQALRRRGVKTIIMGGIATNFGVESTARSAQEHGYKLVFAEDAMTSVKAEMHAFAVENLFPMMGFVRSSEEIMGAL